MAAKRADILSAAVWVGGLMPIGLLALQWSDDELGSNPIGAALKQLGLLGLIALMASLACTPLQLIFKWTWPVLVRRTLGLLGAVYVTLHLLMYVVVDHGADLTVLYADVLKRPFVTVGFTVWLLLIPLVLTSTAASIRRLGFNRWKKLHRLAYVCGALGVTHFFLSQKKSVVEPVVYGVVLAFLFFIRWMKRKRTPTSRQVEPRAAI